MMNLTRINLGTYFEGDPAPGSADEFGTPPTYDEDYGKYIPGTGAGSDGEVLTYGEEIDPTEPIVNYPN